MRNVKFNIAITLITCFMFYQSEAKAIEDIQLPLKAYVEKAVADTPPLEINAEKFSLFIPNPNVFVYGKTKGLGYPVLLLNGSFNVLDNLSSFNPDKTKTITFYLKIQPSQDFYFKILNISIDNKIQTIKYDNTNKSSYKINPEIKGFKAIELAQELTLNQKLESQLPILTSGGLSSDTINVTLKRGKHQPISPGQITYTLKVLALPKKTEEGDLTRKLISQNELTFYKYFIVKRLKKQTYLPEGAILTTPITMIIDEQKLDGSDPESIWSDPFKEEKAKEKALKEPIPVKIITTED